MANEVYLLTHDGLSQMVSARAATRFLDKALEAKGLSPDSVTSEDMREILQGPILRELRQILPKDGVERSIKQISRNLRKQAEKVAEAMLAVANAPAAMSVSSLPSVSGDVLLTGEDETTQPTPEQVLAYTAAESDSGTGSLGIVNHSSHVEDSETFDTGEVAAALDHALNSTTVIPENMNPAPTNDTPLDFTPIDFASANFGSVDVARVDVAATQSAPVAAQQITPPSAVTVHDVASASIQAPAPDYSPEQLAKMLVKFAQLENIKVVAAVKPNGEISMARGSGFDVDALSRLGSLGIKLLSRNRKIRSYYLSQSRYQLFLFPLYSTTAISQTLIVVGSNEVNVGDVFSVRSHLEEDL